MSTSLSRRNMLKLLGVGALGVGAGALPLPKRTWAQSNVPFGSFYRFMLGGVEMAAIQDASVTFGPEFVAANAPEEAAALLDGYGLPSGMISLSINVLLANTGDGLVLMDTGNGVAAGGQLISTLAQLGVAPEDIGIVIISHFHPDHINGLMGEGGAVFPNATLYFPEPEYGFMQGGPYGNEQLDGLIAAANATLEPYMTSEQMELYGDGAELPGGVKALYTPGHSPGHMGYMVTAGDESLLLSVDTAIHAPISVEHPEWHMIFDADPELAVQSRRAILQRAVDERMRVLGYHFPFPGLGYISTQGDGFRFTPQS